MHVTMRYSTELFFRLIFHWIKYDIMHERLQIIGQRKKQRYSKSWLCYSDYINTWLSEDCPRTFTLAITVD